MDEVADVEMIVDPGHVGLGLGGDVVELGVDLNEGSD